MHINYRRKNKDPSHYPKRGNCYIYLKSLKWWQREYWGRQRAIVRRRIYHEDYEKIGSRYPRDLLWRLW